MDAGHAEPAGGVRVRTLVERYHTRVVGVNAGQCARAG